MDPVEKEKLTALEGRGRTAVAMPLTKQNGMPSSRVQVDRLALDRSVDS